MVAGVDHKKVAARVTGLDRDEQLDQPWLDRDLEA
jgi:hypothetical protein